MKAHFRNSALGGSCLLLAGVLTSATAMAQVLGPPSFPPPKLDKPSQPLAIQEPFKAEAEEEPPAAQAAPVQQPVKRLQALDGPWRSKRVTLELKDQSVAEALASAAKQAGLGIAVASSAASNKNITLSVAKQPAGEVLDLLLELGELRAELRGGILYVTAVAPEASFLVASPGKPPAAQPQLQVKGPGFSVRVDADDSDESSNDSSHGSHKSWRHGRDKKAERVQIGQPVRVEAGESVQGVVSVGGSVTVVGHVTGDAVSVGGSVVVEPTGIVDGDAVAVGGALQIQPGGQVNGEQVSVGIPFFGGDDDPDDEGSSAPLWLLPGLAGAFTMLSILGALLRAAVIIVAALLALLLAPRRVETVRRYLVDNPGFSFGGGLVACLLGVLLVILLAITLVGIPLALLVIVALFVCSVLGMASLFIWLGERFPFTRGKSQVLALLLGAFIIALLGTIPYVGWAFHLLVSLAAIGAAVLTRGGSDSESATRL